MLTSSKRVDVVDTDTGASVGFAEFGTIVGPNGREFIAGGARVDPERAAGYPEFQKGRESIGCEGMMNDWEGKPIGTCRIVGAWRVQSFMGSHMLQIEATIQGRTYTGRGFGSGMLWRGKAKRGR